MIARERRMVMIIGGALGLVVSYQVIDRVFLKPRSEADKRIVNYQNQAAKLQVEIDKAKRLREAWKEMAARTFGPVSAENRFDRDLKRLMEKNHLRGDPPTTRALKQELVRKTGIREVRSNVEVEGDYEDAMAFLRDLYDTPYICRISDLGIKPLPTGRRSDVEMALVVEIPLLPEINRNEAEHLGKFGTVQTLDQFENPPTDPARPNRPPEGSYTVLAGRNILKMYVAPPENFVTVVNEDWQPVTVTFKPFWEGQAYGPQLELVVEGKKSEVTKPFKGDAVDGLAVYTSDEKTYGPERLTGQRGGQWILKVPVHSPEPVEPNVELAVHNEDDAEVDLVVTVQNKNGQSITKPTMRIPAQSQLDIDRYEDVQSVTVTATYASGKLYHSETFTPTTTKQIYTVVVEEQQPEALVEMKDPPSNPDLTLTAMTTYPGVHEMIASNSKTRERIIFATGQNVDGGRLLAVHTQGGVVSMPATNHYYLYPFGRAFTDRVLLDVGEDATQEEFAEAIAKWALEDAMTASR